MIPPEARTVVDCFLARPERVHYTFDHGNGRCREYPGSQLAAEAAGLALHLRQLGVAPGDRVAVVVPTSEPLLRTIVAAWFARAAIVVLPHRLGGSRSAASAEKLQRMLAKVTPRVVVGYAEVEAAVRAALGEDQHYLAAETLGDIGPAPVETALRPEPGDLAVLQFSSGSTREPKAVIVRHEQQLIHSDIASKASDYGCEDVVFNWLPIYHDFALAAGVVFPLAAGLKCIMMPTECLLADPSELIRSMSIHAPQISALTPSSLDLLAARAKSVNNLPHYHGLKYVWLAAEPIFPRRLERSKKALEPFLNLEMAIKPAYGLAEAVVAVSTTSAKENIKIARISRAKIRLGLICAPESELDAIEFVSCGTIVDTMKVQIANEHGNSLPQPARGRILISGPTVTTGYWDETQSEPNEHWLDTGDDGFVIDGNLYVCGRRKDVIIRGGSNFDCSEIESESILAAEDSGLPIAAVAAFSVLDDSAQRERSILLIETFGNKGIEERDIAALRSEIFKRTGLSIDEFNLSPSKLPRTTSGKIQRPLCKAYYLEAITGA